MNRDRICKNCNAHFVLKLRGESERHTAFCSDLCHNSFKQARDARWRAGKIAKLGYKPCRACFEARPEPDRVLCKACKERQKRNPSGWAAIKERAIRSRTCFRCGSETPEGDWLCPPHREEAKEHLRREMLALSLRKKRG